MQVALRVAEGRDAAAVQAVYAPYVRETAVTFEEEVPGASEMRQRIEAVLPHYPYLVADSPQGLVGYAYAQRDRARAAYRWNAALSVYLDPQARGKGIGTALYRALISLLEAQGIENLYAGITLPNPASVALHGSLGFRQAGVYAQTGYKLGKWHDVLWMEKRIGDAGATPRQVVDFAQLPAALVQDLLHAKR